MHRLRLAEFRARGSIRDQSVDNSRVNVGRLRGSQATKLAVMLMSSGIR